MVRETTYRACLGFHFCRCVKPISYIQVFYNCILLSCCCLAPIFALAGGQNGGAVLAALAPFMRGAEGGIFFFLKKNLLELGLEPKTLGLLDPRSTN